MFFYFKKKKVVWDVFTSMPNAIELHPIASVGKYLPESFKKMPSTYQARGETSNMTVPRSTLKGCDGFLDMMRTGFVLPLWSDMKFQTAKIGWQAELPDASGYPIVQHDPGQLGSMFKDFQNCKLVSPWGIKSPVDIPSYWGTPSWLNIESAWKNFQVLPGVINFAHTHQTNIPMLLPKESREFTIPFLTPMVHIVPITEHDVQLKFHQVDDKEFHNVVTNPFNRTFHGGYKKVTRARKNESAGGKCPFGFGKK